MLPGRCNRLEIRSRSALGSTDAKSLLCAFPEGQDWNYSLITRTSHTHSYATQDLQRWMPYQPVRQVCQTLACDYCSQSFADLALTGTIATVGLYAAAVGPPAPHFGVCYVEVI